MIITSQNKIAHLILSLVIILSIGFQLYLLFGITEGRYAFHCDCLLRAISAYKWAQDPFITFSPRRFPLEFIINGSLLKIWPNIVLALPLVNILFTSGILIWIYAITRLFSKRFLTPFLAVIPATLFPPLIQSSIGCLSETILIFFIMGAFFLFFKFNISLLSRRKIYYPLLYLSSFSLLLASATRVEGWFFVILFILGGCSLWRETKLHPESKLKIHLILSMVLGTLFIWPWLVYSALSNWHGHPLHVFIVYSLALEKTQNQLTPLLRYPITLFKINPVFIILALILSIFTFFKKSLPRKYLLAVLLAFIGYLISALLIGTSYLTSRTILIVAILLCPVTAIGIERIFQKKAFWGGAIAIILMAGCFSMIHPLITELRQYQQCEGHIDILGKKLKKIAGELSKDDKILVELGDRSGIPIEYYLYYYCPERLTWDKAGYWCREWRLALFPRSFSETYLGKGDSINLFKENPEEFKKTLKENRVNVIVTFSSSARDKIPTVFQSVDSMGKYTIWVRK